jgi:hypothetical protein
MQIATTTTIPLVKALKKERSGEMFLVVVTENWIPILRFTICSVPDGDQDRSQSCCSVEAQVDPMIRQIP